MQCPDTDLMSDAIRELDKPRPFLPALLARPAKGNRRTKAYYSVDREICDLSSTGAFLQKFPWRSVEFSSGRSSRK
jgi:hypothetical protein